VGLGLVIVTVTMNAAIDRTLTVPNFQRGQRHRASAGLTLAGARASTSRARSSGWAYPSSQPGSPAAAPARGSSRS